MKHEQFKGRAGVWALPMLRVFRLNPAFELDINPINVMYIDIKHEDEIKEKYITEKGNLNLEFRRKFAMRYTTTSGRNKHPLYLYNYLVLQEKSGHNLPTISDVDVVKQMPGCRLPCTYILSTEDFNNMGFGRILWTEKLLEADRPSDFIISIRSIISEHEKLTVDQNEALSCAIAYYYPRPLPRLLLIEGEQGGPLFEEMDGKEVELNGYPFRAIVCDRLYIEEIRNYLASDMDVNMAAPMIYIQLGENEYEANLMSKNKRGIIFLSKDEIPPPLHSELFYENLFVKERHLACTLGGISDGLTELWDLFPKYHNLFYKDAYMPYRDLLMQ